MPEQEEAMLFDTAILWELAGNDRDNEPTVLTPYEIVCRWDQGRRYTQDPLKGLVDTAITLITVQEIPIGSIVWHGIFEDLPDPPTDLFEVHSVNITTDIRGVSEYREYELKRFGNTLPEIVGTS
jgi:hypothetical protein